MTKTFFRETVSNPNISHLKKQAKELLSDLQVGNPLALARLKASHSRGTELVNNVQEICLSDAQLVLARECGFESWPKLKAHLEESSKERGRDAKSRLADVLADLRSGGMCILFDDEGRENEGDFVVSAEKISPEAINFMTKHGRGTLCLSMTDQQVSKIGILPINPERRDLAEPGFMVSIDASHGVTTGVSAFDRARTIQAAIENDATPDSVKSPGHVFPLKAHEGGIRARQGHTEGSIELMRLAGLKPAAVICEILKDDGTMARWPDLLQVAEMHNLKVVKISDLV